MTDEETKESSVTEPYATQDCYERACELGALKEKHSKFVLAMQRPLSDHIYFQPGCSNSDQFVNALHGQHEYGGRVRSALLSSYAFEKVVGAYEATGVIERSQGYC